jgi:biotin synthase
MGDIKLVEHVRVAFGTGVVLGLWHGQLATAPTTAHFLTYYEGKCNANCQFCPQARGSTADPKMLSRVVWPRYDLERVLLALEEKNDEFARICVQTVNYKGVIDDVCEIVAQIKNRCNTPISVSCQPLEIEDIRRLEEVGVERVSIALDAATPELFDMLKGVGSCYTWEGHLKALDDARTIFGDRVSTHLIVGLGESERDMVQTIQFLHDRNITVGLFAFTPIVGTPLADKPQPDTSSYRRIQLARFLIATGRSKAERMRFENGQIVDFGVEKEVLNKVIESGEPFRTSGCPGCNRPFYNESPRGPIYNYPRKPTSKEIKIILGQL